MESQGLETKQENSDVANTNMKETLEPGEIYSDVTDVELSSSESSSSLCNDFDSSKETSIEIENYCIEKIFTDEGRRVYLKNGPLIFMKNKSKENDRGYCRRNCDLYSEKSCFKNTKRNLNHPSNMQDHELIKKFKKLTEKIELNLFKLNKIKNCITESKNVSSINLTSSTTRNRINKYKKELLHVKYLNISDGNNEYLQSCLGTKELIQNNLQKNSSQFYEHKIKSSISNSQTEEDEVKRFSDRISKEDLDTKKTKLKKTSSARKSQRSHHTHVKLKSKKGSNCNLQYDKTKTCHDRYWHFKHKNYLQSPNFHENAHSTSRLYKTSSSKYRSHNGVNRREVPGTNIKEKYKRSEGHEYHSRICDYQNIKDYQLYLSNNSEYFINYDHQSSHFSEQFQCYGEQYNKYTNANELHKSNYFNLNHTNYSEKQNFYSNYIDQGSSKHSSGVAYSPSHQIHLSRNSSLSLENGEQHTNASMVPNFINTQCSSKSESSLKKLLVQPPPPGIESPSHFPLPAYTPTMKIEQKFLHHCDNQSSPFSTCKFKNSYDATSSPHSNRCIEDVTENNRNKTLLNEKIAIVNSSEINESYKALSQSDPVAEHQDTNTNQDLGIANKLLLLNMSENINTNPSQDNFPEKNNSLDSNEFNIFQPRCLNFDERNKNEDPINISNATKNSNDELKTMHSKSHCSSMLINYITEERGERQSELFKEYNNDSIKHNNSKESNESISIKQDGSLDGISIHTNYEYNLSNNQKEVNVQGELITIHPSNEILATKNILPQLIESNIQEPQVNNFNLKEEDFVIPCKANVIKNKCDLQTGNNQKYVYQKIYNFSISPEDSKKSMGQISEYIKHSDVLKDNSERNAIFYAYHKNETKSYKSKITFQKSEQNFIETNDIRRKCNIVEMICSDLGEKQSDIKNNNNPLSPMILKLQQSTSSQTPKVLKQKRKTKIINKSATEENNTLHNKNKGKVYVENNKALSSMNGTDGGLKSCRSLQCSETIINQPKVSISLSRRDDKSLKKSVTAETKIVFKKKISSKIFDKNINIRLNKAKNIKNYSNQKMANQDISNKLSVYKGALDLKHICKKHKVCANQMPSRSKNAKKLHISKYSLCWLCRSSTKSVGSFANIDKVPTK